VGTRSGRETTDAKEAVVTTMETSAKVQGVA
jgi:hypothetical protein